MGALFAQVNEDVRRLEGARAPMAAVVPSAAPPEHLFRSLETDIRRLDSGFSFQWADELKLQQAVQWVRSAVDKIQWHRQHADPQASVLRRDLPNRAAPF